MKHVSICNATFRFSVHQYPSEGEVHKQIPLCITKEKNCRLQSPETSNGNTLDIVIMIIKTCM